MIGLNQRGVTLVELLIVLGITSLIFIIFIQVFQNFSKTENLKQSTHRLETEINDILNDYRTGNTFDLDHVRCTKDPSDPTKAIFEDLPGAKVGENNECIFVGKVIQLGVADPTYTTTPKVGSNNPRDYDDDYLIYTLISLTSGVKLGGTIAEQSRVERYQILKSTSSPIFDATQSGKTIGSTTISKTFIWTDDNTIAGFQPTASGATPADSIVYIDGLAILVAGFGAVTDTTSLEFQGGARHIVLKGVYIADINKSNSSRQRPNRSDFEARTHLHLPSTSTTYYQDVAGGEMIICLDAKGGVSYIRVGNKSGALFAEADLDPTRAKAKCVF